MDATYIQFLFTINTMMLEKHKLPTLSILFHNKIVIQINNFITLSNKLLIN